MTLLSFVPTVTPHSADVARCYDYGPSVAGSRMWWCSGLGTDTIVSAPMPGRPGKPGAPWHIPGRLVADPCAVSIGHQTLVLHTVGLPDGTGNGIGWALWSDPARPPQAAGTLITGTPAGRYGIGQPGVALRGNGGGLLICRDDGPAGENRLAAWDLLIGDDGTPILGNVVPFAEPEDGASPECWWTSTGRVAILVSGGGWVGVRTYDCEGGTLLSRQRHLETPSPVPGGEFWAQAPASSPGAVDGLGVERDAHNRPIVVDGTVRYWQARGDHTQPGTWALHRASYALPESAR